MGEAESFNQTATAARCVSENCALWANVQRFVGTLGPFRGLDTRPERRNQPLAHAMQCRQIGLIVGLDRHKTHVTFARGVDWNAVFFSAFSAI